MSKRLLGIGDVYTYDYKQVHKTRNVGFGYYDPNKVSTTSSTDGYVLVDGVLSVVNEDGSSEPGPGPADDETKIGDQTWKNKNIAYDDGGDGIYKVDNVTVNGVNFGTQYYYNSDAAIRIMNNFPGWHIPTQVDVELLYNHVAGDSDSLRSTSGWNDDMNGNNLNSFNASPIGIYDMSTEAIENAGIESDFYFIVEESQAYYCREFSLKADNSFNIGYARVYQAHPIRLIKD